MAQVHKIGRRKTSTARVYLKPGKGDILVNKRPFETYFPLLADRNTVLLPLRIADLDGQYDIKITVAGGGVSGQAGAVQLGIARAVDEMFPDKHTLLKSHDLFTRDDRMVERKKYGQPKARKKFQFSKR